MPNYSYKYQNPASNYKETTDINNSFRRTKNMPLDQSSVFNSYLQAKEYAKGSGSNIYNGQIITVTTREPYGAYGYTYGSVPYLVTSDKPNPTTYDLERIMTLSYLREVFSQQEYVHDFELGINRLGVGLFYGVSYIDGAYIHSYGEIFNDYNSNIAGPYSHAEGQNTSIYGPTSHGEGTNNIIDQSTSVSHIEGSNNEIVDGSDYSHVEGYGNSMSGTSYRGHIEGLDNRMENSNNSHIGGSSNLVSDGENNTVIGTHNSTYEGSNVFIQGSFNENSGTTIHIEGTYNAVGQNVINSHIEGQYNNILSTTEDDKVIGAHAEGTNNTVLSNFGHAEGEETRVSGIAAHSEGIRTVAGGEGAHAEGNTTIASGQSAHSEGQNTAATGISSHAEGSKTIASGSFSHAEGADTNANGIYSHAEGTSTSSTGISSHAEGSYTNATLANAHSEGAYTLAGGINAHAEGSYTSASNYSAHAEGYMSYASNVASHAEGYNTYSDGPRAHSEGSYTHANGESSHAEGIATTANGTYSHAEGHFTTTVGTGAHTEGSYTTASGFYSHAEGVYTTSNGQGSMAIGYGSNSIGDYSFVTGTYNITNNRNEVAIGAYNKSYTGQGDDVLKYYEHAQTESGGTIFTIGNGTDKDNRNNIIAVHENGDMIKSEGVTYHIHEIYSPLSYSYVNTLGITAYLGNVLRGLCVSPEYRRPMVGMQFSSYSEDFRLAPIHSEIQFGDSIALDFKFRGAYVCPDIKDEDPVYNYLDPISNRLGYSTGINTISFKFVRNSYNIFEDTSIDCLQVYPAKMVTSINNLGNTTSGICQGLSYGCNDNSIVLKKNQIGDTGKFSGRIFDSVDGIYVYRDETCPKDILTTSHVYADTSTQSFGDLVLNKEGTWTIAYMTGYTFQPATQMLFQDLASYANTYIMDDGRYETKKFTQLGECTYIPNSYISWTVDVKQHFYYGTTKDITSISPSFDIIKNGYVGDFSLQNFTTEHPGIEDIITHKFHTYDSDNRTLWVAIPSNRCATIPTELATSDADMRVACLIFAAGARIQLNPLGSFFSIKTPGSDGVIDTGLNEWDSMQLRKLTTNYQIKNTGMYYDIYYVNGSSYIPNGEVSFTIKRVW